MNCQRCGFEDWKVLHFVKREKYCGDCASIVFQISLKRLRSRYKNLNKKYKQALKIIKETT